MILQNYYSAKTGTSVTVSRNIYTSDSMFEVKLDGKFQLSFCYYVKACEYAEELYNGTQLPREPLTI